MIVTERLAPRPWGEEDAPALYTLASDPAIGPAAEWPAHGSVEESLGSIRTVLAAPETYAVCLRTTGELVGCVSLVEPRCGAAYRGASKELELGYRIGRSFWGHGFAPRGGDRRDRSRIRRAWLRGPLVRLLRGQRALPSRNGKVRLRAPSCGARRLGGPACREEDRTLYVPGEVR